MQASDHESADICVKKKKVYKHILLLRQSTILGNYKSALDLLFFKIEYIYIDERSWKRYLVKT